MKRAVELKHVGPKEHVRTLIEDLIDRLEDKLQHFPSDALSVHVLFDENGTHKLYHISLTCHIPGHMVVAHEEGRNPGSTIREAFKEVQRQLEKHNALRRREHLRKRSQKSAREAAEEML